MEVDVTDLRLKAQAYKKRGGKCRGEWCRDGTAYKGLLVAICGRCGGTGERCMPLTPDVVIELLDRLEAAERDKLGPDARHAMEHYLAATKWAGRKHRSPDDPGGAIRSRRERMEKLLGR